MRDDYISQINKKIYLLKILKQKNSEKIKVEINEILNQIPTDLNIQKLSTLKKIKEELTIDLNKIYCSIIKNDSDVHNHYKKWGCGTNINYSFRQLIYLNKTKKPLFL